MWPITIEISKIRHRRYIVPMLCFSCFVFSQNKQGYQQNLKGADVTLEMQLIPDGYLTKKLIANNGSTLHKSVHVNAFWMSKYEITWELYRLFLNRNIDELEINEKGKDVVLDVDAVAGATIPYVDMSLGMGTDDKLPVCNVTQMAASKFCEWLSAVTGYFYRLPTENEWEYAARAGSRNEYFFGDESSLLSDYAWYMENSDDTYHKVGEKKPNPYGLHDIYGNVSEWVLTQDHQNDFGMAEGSQKRQMVIRGGSFKDSEKDVGNTTRDYARPHWKIRDPQFPKSKWWNTDSPFVGFRIVRPIIPPPQKTYEEYWNTSE